MRILIVLLIFIPTFMLSSAQTESDTGFQQIAFAQDADGNDVLFDLIPNSRDSKIGASNNGYFVIQDDNKMRIYETSTLRLKSEFKIPSQAKVTQITDSGYILRSDKEIEHKSFDGRVLWSSKNFSFLIDSNNKVAVFLNRKGKDTSFTGVDLYTGDEIWNQPMSMDNHNVWCGVHIGENDNRFAYMIGDSLMRLDLKTGDVLSRPFRTSTKYKKSFPYMKAGLPTSPEFGREMISSGDKIDVVTGLHSNWIDKGDSLIIADADSLYCLDKTLNTLWSTALPDEGGAFSTIKLSGGKILLLNHGIGLSAKDAYKVGKPYAVVYDVHNGERLSLTVPNLDKRVIDGQFGSDDIIYWQNNKDFYVCSVGDSIVRKINWKQQTKKLWDEKEADHAPYILCDTIYTVEGGEINPKVTDGSRLLVEVYCRDVNEITPDGSVTLIPDSEVYFKKQYVSPSSVYTSKRKYNLYITNRGYDKTNTFVVTEVGKNKIVYTLKVKGWITMDNDGNIVVITPLGVAVKRAAIAQE